MNFRRLVFPPLAIGFLLFLFVVPFSAFASGATWTQHTEVGQFYWYAVAASADGTKLAVAADENDSGDPGYVWTSTNAQAPLKPAARHCTNATNPDSLIARPPFTSGREISL